MSQFPFLFFIFFFLLLFRAAPEAYGSSQARGLNWNFSCLPTPEPQQCGTQATSATYTIAHGNTGSPTHWARPGIKPASSWIRVGFVTTEPQWELLDCSCLSDVSFANIFSQSVACLLVLLVQSFAEHISFLIYALNTRNFLLSTAFTASHKFWYVFTIGSKYVLISLETSLSNPCIV